MNNNRITGDVRPTQVTVLSEFVCQRCERAHIEKTLGEEFYPINAPDGWTWIAHGGKYGNWICDHHEIKVEDKRR